MAFQTEIDLVDMTIYNSLSEPGEFVSFTVQIAPSNGEVVPNEVIRKVYGFTLRRAGRFVMPTILNDFKGHDVGEPTTRQL
jgi:hypothetical protein